MKNKLSENKIAKMGVQKGVQYIDYKYDYNMMIKVITGIGCPNTLNVIIQPKSKLVKAQFTSLNDTIQLVSLWGSEFRFMCD